MYSSQISRLGNHQIILPVSKLGGIRALLPRRPVCQSKVEIASLASCSSGIPLPRCWLDGCCYHSRTFVVAVALIPLCLFAWFGCGGIFFPLFHWIGTAALAAFMARDSVFDGAAYFWAVACVAGIAYVTIRTRGCAGHSRWNGDFQGMRGRKDEGLD